MTPGATKKSIVFIVLGVLLVALAVALNVSWIVINWRAGLLLVLGIVFFLVIIGGLVLNTVFLVREVRRNEQHDAFINAVTHELKTPIASIRLYLETLQRRELPVEKRQEFYQVMLDDTDRLLQVVEQVLRAGRIGARHHLRHKTRVDLRELVRETVDLARVRHHLTEQALAYAEEVNDAQRATVLGDAEELKAAVSNLVDNAIKYSGAQVQVEIDVLAVNDRHIAVRVRDHGIGISPAETKRIFKRFYRIPEAVALRVKGTGLGLFIVRSIARKHGGRVSAQSDGPGRGSTFTLQLPIAPAV